MITILLLCACCRCLYTILTRFSHNIYREYILTEIIYIYISTTTMTKIHPYIIVYLPTPIYRYIYIICVCVCMGSRIYNLYCGDINVRISLFGRGREIWPGEHLGITSTTALYIIRPPTRPISDARNAMNVARKVSDGTPITYIRRTPTDLLPGVVRTHI